MEFKTGPDQKIAVKIDGAEYQLRQPLVKDIKKLSKMGSLGNDKVLDETINFLSDLGMPSDKLEEMSMGTLEQLFTFITTSKKN